jgi:ABC-type Fe3+-hydroxamate transport system substrate-binding protein
MSFYNLFGMFFLLSFLAACGGGSGSAGTDKPDKPPTGNNKVKTLRVATFGDSTANASSLATQDISLFQANLNGHQLIAPNKYQLSFYYPAAYLVGNGGVGGETPLSMRHRDVEPVSTQRKSTEDIIALKPQVILFRGGSINDLPNVNKKTIATIVDETYTRHITLLEKFTNANLPVRFRYFWLFLSQRRNGGRRLQQS